jgi:hypothetical protein
MGLTFDRNCFGAVIVKPVDVTLAWSYINLRRRIEHFGDQKMFWDEGPLG